MPEWLIGAIVSAFVWVPVGYIFCAIFSINGKDS